MRRRLPPIRGPSEPRRKPPSNGSAIARARAGTRADVESAAREWLAEINQINHETRDATAQVEKSRSAAVALAMNLERLAVEADAARISAERADEACVAAREAVAACDEARALEAAAARIAPPAPAQAPTTPGADRPPLAPVVEDRRGRIRWPRATVTTR